MGTLVPEDSVEEEAERAHLRLTWDHATSIGRISQSLLELQLQVQAQASDIEDLQSQVQNLSSQVGLLSAERAGFLRAVGVPPPDWSGTSPWTLVHRLVDDIQRRLGHLWRVFGPRQPTPDLSALDP